MATATITATRTKTTMRKANVKTRPAPSRAVAVQQPQVPKSMPQLCAELARDPKVDPAKMEAVLQFATRQEFNRALLLAQTEISEHRITKNAYNDHTKSQYIKLEALSAIVDPIVHKHGISLSFGMSDSPKDDHYRVTCDVAHLNGHVMHKFIDVGEDTAGPKGTGTKSKAQGSGSSTSYGRRYLKFMIFDIATFDDDDGVGGKPKVKTTIDEKQLKELTAALATEGAPPEDKFLDAFRIKALDELPIKRFSEAMDRIADRIAKYGAKAKEEATT